MEQVQPNIGGRPGENAKRDAVHIAVAPAVAACCLKPGDRVGRLTDGRYGRVLPYLGIVDPYLPFAIVEGEPFWLFLLPNTITSLRHVWTHPAFKPEPPAAKEKKNG